MPVGPAAQVCGQVAYPDLRDVPGQVDLAVIATPAATVPGIVRSAADQGVAAVVVLSAGFAETGDDGARLQDEAVAAARAGGVRLVGPNCFGVQNADLPLNASIAAGTPRGGGGVTIVTQSGSYGMAVHALGQDEGLRVAKVFAAGNKADITDAELLAYLRQDPDTSVICLLLESITDARGFFAEACLTTPHKPVIAVVGGRTSAGQRAAVSHTAALASDDAVRDAALRQAGVVRVRTGLQVLDAARALSSQPVPRGPRVAVITNSGGTGVELTDLLADEGLVVPELSESLQARLRAIMPAYASARNPVDMTPAWNLFATVYPDAIEMLARSGEVDVIVPVLLQRSASAEVATAVRDAVARLRAAAVPVPVYVCWVAPRSADEHARLLNLAGVPCFPWPERTAQVAGVAVRCGLQLGKMTARRWGRATGRLAGATTAHAQARRTPRPATAPRPRRCRPPHPTASCRSRPRGTCWWPAGSRLLRPCAAAARHRRRRRPTAWAIPWSRRLIIPIWSTRATPAGCGWGWGTGLRWLRPPLSYWGSRRGHWSWCSISTAGSSCWWAGCGTRSSGPMVVAGLGGVLVEDERDVQLAVAPVDTGQAGPCCRSLRGAAILGGLRGSPPVHLGFVAETIVAVGDLMVAHPEIAELDLNPVLAGPDGCVAVDWRISTR